MKNVAHQLKQGVGHAIESLSDGWRELRSRAGEALTRFRSDAKGDNTDMTAFDLPSMGRWAFMAADVFDDDDRVIVRLEAPGMRRDDFDIQLLGTTLSIRGEKRLDRETRSGGYSLVQCAYGEFQRDVALPVEVQAERARASYRDGVLRIELPKTEGARRRQVSVKVH